MSEHRRFDQMPLAGRLLAMFTLILGGATVSEQGYMLYFPGVSRMPTPTFTSTLTPTRTLTRTPSPTNTQRPQ
ncbi:MAG: hypothetical protein FJ026_13025, partial [Chloroflexi bacterium]|nr:hypothetical protein [Chloroflexota bacterium]